MVELAGLVVAVLFLCTLGLLLDAARAPRWVGGVPLAVAGGVAGFVGTLVLALALWPGACVAVLCPTCYREPPEGAVWRATLAFSILVGAAAVALPCNRFRVGFALGAAPQAIGFAGDAFEAGGGTAVLLAGAVALSLWAVRHEIAGRLGASAGPGATGIGEGARRDFWDGARWGSSPAGAGVGPGHPGPGRR